MKKILKLLGMLALASKGDVAGLHIAFEGGKPLLHEDGLKIALDNLSVLNADLEEVRYLTLIGEQIFAEVTNQDDLLLVASGDQISPSFLIWAKGGGYA